VAGHRATGAAALAADATVGEKAASTALTTDTTDRIIAQGVAAGAAGLTVDQSGA